MEVFAYYRRDQSDLKRFVLVMRGSFELLSLSSVTTIASPSHSEFGLNAVDSIIFPASYTLLS